MFSSLGGFREFFKVKKGFLMECLFFLGGGGFSFSCLVLVLVWALEGLVCFFWGGCVLSFLDFVVVREKRPIFCNFRGFLVFCSQNPFFKCIFFLPCSYFLLLLVLLFLVLLLLLLLVSSSSSFISIFDFLSSPYCFSVFLFSLSIVFFLCCLFHCFLFCF